MADNDGIEPVEEQKSGGKKKLIFIAAGVVVLIAAIVGALFAFGIIGGGDPNAEGGGDAAEDANPVDPAVLLPTMALDPFVVNLADADQSRFLKVSITIELTREELREAVEQRKEKVKDAVITLLSSKSVAHVRDEKGKLKLKQEITLRLNEILGTTAVNDVWFTEFIIS
jgi:flagellar protein FliL